MQKDSRKVATVHNMASNLIETILLKQRNCLPHYSTRTNAIMYRPNFSGSDLFHSLDEKVTVAFLEKEVYASLSFLFASNCAQLLMLSVRLIQSVWCNYCVYRK